MKALTIRQPWADAITHGSKRVENRTWTTNYRGQILIHAGATDDRHAILPFGENTARRNYPDTRSAILAVANLTDCHAYADCCEPWGNWDVYHWQLSNVRPLQQPVPCKGRLGFWTPPAEVLAAVEKQLAEVSA
ncbi:ASCH domain-containing protein [Streptomyces qinglanensis]|uniref:ASCH domain-containing protein n=1 Tax=Streptomyces qinglanensis TaxID=943816 RepID=A0A1H9U4S2_9ACTN|nr:ASCH domain-containing protein [Streptomyces qinglanensis]SES04167.1 ASCH domain-containing protein [Streptomyces qinglanensis]